MVADLIAFCITWKRYTTSIMGSYNMLDFVQETVVHISNRLAITALQFAKVSPSKQTKDFVKACLTFNGITIPSITSVIQRMHLFLETAEVRVHCNIKTNLHGVA